MKIGKKRPKDKLVSLILVPQGHLFTIPDIEVIAPNGCGTRPTYETIFMMTDVTFQIVELLTGNLYDLDDLGLNKEQSVIDVNERYELQEL